MSGAGLLTRGGALGSWPGSTTMSYDVQSNSSSCVRSEGLTPVLKSQCASRATATSAAAPAAARSEHECNTHVHACAACASVSVLAGRQRRTAAHAARPRHLCSSRPRPLVVADALGVLPKQARLLHQVQRGVLEQLALHAVVVCAKRVSRGLARTRRAHAAQAHRCGLRTSWRCG